MRCGESCLVLQADPANCGECGKVCPSTANGSASCTAGRCGLRCNAGFSKCGAQCVDDGLVQTARLAGLGTLSVCDALAALDALSQASMCPPQQAFCAGRCVDVRTDTQNCGVCGKVCRSQERCRAGECRR